LRAIRGCGVHHTPIISPASGLLPRRPFPGIIRVHPCPSVVKKRGCLYHPADVFTSDGAEDAFLKCLGEVCEKPGWKVHGYVDMRNDYHVA
jgi:hypothetical protein